VEIQAAFLEDQGDVLAVRENVGGFHPAYLRLEDVFRPAGPQTLLPPARDVPST